jgi:RNA-directed DNA polymerase
MTAGDADNGAEMPRARPEGRGRKPREDGMGASNVTARSDHSAPEANVRLMELIVSRENMMAAYARVVGNKGCQSAFALREPLSACCAFPPANLVND